LNANDKQEEYKCFSNEAIETCFRISIQLALLAIASLVALLTNQAFAQVQINRRFDV